jgi:hypothetical protein
VVAQATRALATEVLRKFDAVMFSERFQPDFDAVYLTFKDEMVSYLDRRVQWLDIPVALDQRCRTERLILLHGRKL